MDWHDGAESYSMLLCKAQQSGKIFPEVYAEHVRLQTAARQDAGKDEGHNGYPDAPVADGEIDLAKELAEAQNQSATSKSETGLDSVRLREELLDAQREIEKLNAALAKANAKTEYMTGERRVCRICRDPLTNF